MWKPISNTATFGFPGQIAIALSIPAIDPGICKGAKSTFTTKVDWGYKFILDKTKIAGSPEKEYKINLNVKPTYNPAVTIADLSKCLPDFVTESLREAFPKFNKKISCFASL